MADDKDGREGKAKPIMERTPPRRGSRSVFQSNLGNRTSTAPPRSYVRGLVSQIEARSPAILARVHAADTGTQEATTGTEDRTAVLHVRTAELRTPSPPTRRPGDAQDVVVSEKLQTADPPTPRSAETQGHDPEALNTLWDQVREVLQLGSSDDDHDGASSPEPKTGRGDAGTATAGSESTAPTTSRRGPVTEGTGSGTASSTTSRGRILVAVRPDETDQEQRDPILPREEFRARLADLRARGDAIVAEEAPLPRQYRREEVLWTGSSVDRREKPPSPASRSERYREIVEQIRERGLRQHRLGMAGSSTAPPPEDIDIDEIGPLEWDPEMDQLSQLQRSMTWDAFEATSWEADEQTEPDEPRRWVTRALDDGDDSENGATRTREETATGPADEECEEGNEIGASSQQERSVPAAEEDPATSTTIKGKGRADPTDDDLATRSAGRDKEQAETPDDESSRPMAGQSSVAEQPPSTELAPLAKAVSPSPPPIPPRAPERDFSSSVRLPRRASSAPPVLVRTSSVGEWPRGQGEAQPPELRLAGPRRRRRPGPRGVAIRRPTSMMRPSRIPRPLERVFRPGRDDGEKPSQLAPWRERQEGHLREEPRQSRLGQGNVEARENLGDPSSAQPPLFDLPRCRREPRGRRRERPVNGDPSWGRRPQGSSNGSPSPRRGRLANGIVPRLATADFPSSSPFPNNPSPQSSIASPRLSNLPRPPPNTPVGRSPARGVPVDGISGFTWSSRSPQLGSPETLWSLSILSLARRNFRENSISPVESESPTRTPRRSASSRSTSSSIPGQLRIPRGRPASPASTLLGPAYFGRLAPGSGPGSPQPSREPTNFPESAMPFQNHPPRPTAGPAPAPSTFSTPDGFTSPLFVGAALPQPDWPRVLPPSPRAFSGPHRRVDDDACFRNPSHVTTPPQVPSRRASYRAASQPARSYRGGHDQHGNRFPSGSSSVPQRRPRERQQEQPFSGDHGQTPAGSLAPPSARGRGGPSSTSSSTRRRGSSSTYRSRPASREPSVPTSEMPTSHVAILASHAGHYVDTGDGDDEGGGISDDDDEDGSQNGGQNHRHAPHAAPDASVYQRRPSETQDEYDRRMRTMGFF